MTKKEIQNKIEAIHQCEEDGKFELSFVGEEDTTSKKNWKTMMVSI